MAHDDMPRISCELINSETGRQIAWTWGMTSLYKWEWISRTIADTFDCGPDDVDCLDTEDRFDNLVVRGEIVAYVKNRLMGEKT